MTLAVLLIAAYLLGSIPTSYIVVYRFTGRDIRTIGNGNPGTMNVLDAVGLRAASIVGVGDISKGMAAVGLAHLAGLGDMEAVAAAVVAVIGHDYSVFLRLNGGNGLATAVGGIYALLPAAGLIATGTAAVAFVLLRSRRISGLIGLSMLPPLAYWLNAPDMKLIGLLLLLTVSGLKIIRFEGFSPSRSRPPR